MKCSINVNLWKFLQEIIFEGNFFSGAGKNSRNLKKQRNNWKQIYNLEQYRRRSYKNLTILKNSGKFSRNSEEMMLKRTSFSIEGC